MKYANIYAIRKPEDLGYRYSLSISAIIHAHDSRPKFEADGWQVVLHSVIEIDVEANALRPIP